MAQERIHAQPGRDAATHTEDDAVIDEAVAEAQRRTVELEATDELLDEIDAVLEVNAEEFVRNYVQKGGE